MSSRTVAAGLAWIGALVLVAHTASAHVFTVRLQEGEPVPEMGVDAIISDLGHPQVNRVGGWFVDATAETAPDVFVPYVWGTSDGSAPSVLRTLTTSGSLEQHGFSFGISHGRITEDGHLIYAAGCTDENGGVGDAVVFVDDEPAAVKGDPLPRDVGLWWTDWGAALYTSCSATRDGRPLFLGTFSETPNGFPMQGIFLGDDPDPLIALSQTMSPFFAPISSLENAHAEVSDDADHWIATARLLGSGNNYPNTPFLDGFGIILDGLPIRRGFPSPPSLGGQGLPWGYMGPIGISNAGDWFLVTSFVGPSSETVVLLHNGENVLMAGDEIAPNQYLEWIRRAMMNADGDLLVDCNVGAGFVLLLNGEPVVSRGDPIDVDGDGIPELDTTLDSINQFASALSRRTASGDVEILLRGGYEQLGEWSTAILSTTVTPAAVGTPALDSRPAARRLEPPAPNPFSSHTQVRFEIPSTEFVRLDVYDVSGRRLRSLWDGRLAAGSHGVSWDGRVEGGTYAPAGVYFVRLQSASGVDSRRVVRVTSGAR